MNVSVRQESPHRRLRTIEFRCSCGDRWQMTIDGPPAQLVRQILHQPCRQCGTAGVLRYLYRLYPATARHTPPSLLQITLLVLLEIPLLAATYLVEPTFRLHPWVLLIPLLISAPCVVFCWWADVWRRRR